jgi:hypothetical protein
MGVCFDMADQGVVRPFVQGDYDLYRFAMTAVAQHRGEDV